MSMDRRSFLRRTSLALAGGLLVGDEVLEQFAKLTHARKSFPSAAVGGRFEGTPYACEIWERLPNGMWSHRQYSGRDVFYYWDEPLPPVTVTRDTKRVILGPLSLATDLSDG